MRILMRFAAVMALICLAAGTHAQALKFAEQLVERGVDADAVSVHQCPGP